MWYLNKKTKKQQNKQEETEHTADYNLIMPLITTMVRNKLFLQRNYNPTENEVKRNVSKIIKHIEDKYTSLDLFRNKTNSEKLMPRLKEILQQINLH